MTDDELIRKWPRDEFEQWKAQGLYGQTADYAAYLAMRRASEEESMRELARIRREYGGLPHEEPPELTEEDDRLLTEIWAQIARERQEPISAAA
jgi:hypothetical protein